MPKLLLCLMLVLPFGLHAAWESDSQARTTLYTSQTGATTLEEAVAQVQREHGGRLLSAETLTENGRQTHVIKILTPDNRVRTLRVPANGS